MPPKQKLDKEAWLWAESVDPENITQEHVMQAYRLNLTPCKEGACRRNCKGSPFCLSGLGEREWFGEIDDQVWHDIEDPNADRRKEGSFVGLKNLGATCYVNTFIQVWFHNPEFRAAIYKWKEPFQHQPVLEQAGMNGKQPQTTDSEVTFKESTGSGEAVTINNDVKPVVDETEKRLLPTSVVGHLQLIFALLQFGGRRYVDPTNFINCLGLDAGEQQDAQEFSKLLITLLEDTLSRQPDATVRNLIQNQFCGQYDYVTSCNKCGRGSQRPSRFYELDLNIKGHTLLSQCIEEFLQEEKLEGDNQYMCMPCSSKQNATRRIKLRTLPMVLNVQLLRFVFDRKTGHKKKLNSFIQFPEELDMGEYIGKPEGEVLYDLSAVLIHRGPSAYSGHYVAHIRDTSSATWYKFNDEEIEKMAGKNLQLGNEDEMGQGTGGKKPRTPKGCHTSKNAYMLVYQQRGAQAKETPVVSLTDLPQRVQNYIEWDNARFEDWTQDMAKMRDKNVETGRAMQLEVKELYHLLWARDDTSNAWISMEWLGKWLAANNSGEVPVIDNGPVLCSHGRIDPDQVTKLKCISNTGAEIIYSKYGGGPRLFTDSLCQDCVREKCRIIRTKARLDEDSKIIAAVLNSKSQEPTDSSADNYWVGKASLRTWKRLALEKLKEDVSLQKNGWKEENDYGKDDKSNSGSESPCKSTPASQDSSKNSQVKTDKEDDEATLSFNEDLHCEDHDNLSSDTTLMRLIPADVWRRLKVYFPNAPEYHQGAPACRRCQLQEEEERATRELHKTMATEQKSALGDLYHDRHRPVWKKDVTELNIVRKDFVEEWRKFIKDPKKKKVPTATLR